MTELDRLKEAYSLLSDNNTAGAEILANLIELLTIKASSKEITELFDFEYTN